MTPGTLALPTERPNEIYLVGPAGEPDEYGATLATAPPQLARYATGLRAAVDGVRSYGEFSGRLVLVDNKTAAALRSGKTMKDKGGEILAHVLRDDGKISSVTRLREVGGLAAGAASLTAPGMHPYREELFVLQNRGAANASRFFKLPPDQVNRADVGNPASGGFAPSMGSPDPGYRSAMFQPSPSCRQGDPARPSVTRRSAAATGEQIRVASVPAGHPYVQHLADPDGAADVVRLPDVGDPWWPPAMLRPEWVEEHAGSFDVMHVHFGFDSCPPEELVALCDRLRAHGRPLVVTVHDLRNPHHDAPGLHRSQLGVLLEHADAVVTLTQWAASVLRDEYGVCAEVIPHPHIVELDDLRRRQTRPRPATTVVGLHLKSLRPNMEIGVLDAAISAVARTPGAVLRVDVHCDVAERDGARHDADLMRRLHLADRGDLIDLSVHDFFDDHEFVDYVESLAVSVLPYRFGTHSGWLEACRDLGVAVVAPSCGAYADQGAGFIFACDEVDGLDVASCERAIEAALRAPRPAPMPWQDRWQERRVIAARHRELYSDVIARSRSSSPPGST